MTKQILPIEQKTITNSLGIYYKALENDSFIYFVNFNEGDENGCAFMYRKENGSLSLVSNNYFAYVGLMDDLEHEAQTWMSPRMKKNWELYKEAEEL
jgi:hypothetical protein